LSPPPFKEARSAFYYEGPVLDSIHILKYTGRVNVVSALGAMLAASVAFSTRPEVVMPVPLHRQRLRKRGFNQSLLLAREVARRIGLRLDYLNLMRARETAPQVDLKADERKANVAGAFTLRRPGGVDGAKVLLVDDVYTTGSTVRECSKALRKAGAEVYVLTLARAKRT
jgi:ComF family protein